jgi:hypothetical protein
MDLQNAARPATARPVSEPRKSDQLGRQINFDNATSPRNLQVLKLLARFPVSRVRAETIASLAFPEAR